MLITIYNAQTNILHFVISIISYFDYNVWSYVPVLMMCRNMTFWCFRGRSSTLPVLWKFRKKSLNSLWSLLKSLVTYNNCNFFNFALLIFDTVSIKILIKNNHVTFPSEKQVVKFLMLFYYGLMYNKQKETQNLVF